MSGYYPITNELGKEVPKLDIRETKIEVYPPPIVEVEEMSFVGRWKKFLANMMANIVCGVANRSYDVFNGRPNHQILYITSSDYLPV